MSKKSNRRFRRTIALGILALATLVWTAVDQFGVSSDTMLQLAVGSVLIVAVVIVAAGVVVALWQLLQRLIRRGKE